jgi:hypothetical protein
VSGTTLVAGIASNQTDQEPAASALPLTGFSNGAVRYGARPAVEYVQRHRAGRQW